MQVDRVYDVSLSCCCWCRCVARLRDFHRTLCQIDITHLHSSQTEWTSCRNGLLSLIGLTSLEVCMGMGIPTEMWFLWESNAKGSGFWTTNGNGNGNNGMRIAIAYCICVKSSMIHIRTNCDSSMNNEQSLATNYRLLINNDKQKWWRMVVDNAVGVAS